MKELVEQLNRDVEHLRALLEVKSKLDDANKFIIKLAEVFRDKGYIDLDIFKLLKEECLY